MLITTWRRAGAVRKHAGFRCEVRPHGLTAEEATLLGLARGMQAFLVERTRVDAGLRPVQTADLILPADRWRIGWVSAR
jgi:DNA-binding GntR family transcriptional regulator